MTTCTEIRELLPLHAGNDLPPAESDAVAAHLDACPVCRAEARVWRDQHARLANLVASAAPHVDEVRLQGMIAAAADRLPPAAGRRRPSRGRWVVAAAAALAVLVLWTNLREPVAPADSSWATLQEAFAGCLDAPVPLTEWRAARGPGVVAVLARDADGGWVLADCLEAPDLSRLARYPWAQQRIRSWRDAAGDGGLLVAVCRGDLADESTRRRLRARVLGELGVSG